MSSENLVPDKQREGKAGPSRASVILLVAVLLSMGALAASFYPRHVHFVPAPLIAHLPGCVILKSNFIPTDVTEVPFAPVNALPAETKNRVLLHLNTTPCSCGCAQSVVACLLKNPQCKASPELLKQELANAGKQN
ncbi:MAG: hypothetical protein ACRD1I_02275 [Terriglobia bacterium]